jgi:hypothetical protein
VDQGILKEEEAGIKNAGAEITRREVRSLLFRCSLVGVLGTWSNSNPGGTCFASGYADRRI